MGTMLAPAVAGYAPPAVAFTGETAERDEVVWWAVFVGFAYALSACTFMRNGYRVMWKPRWVVHRGETEVRR